MYLNWSALSIRIYPANGPIRYKQRVLQTRTDNMKAQANRRSKFSHQSNISPMVQLHQPLFRSAANVVNGNESISNEAINKRNSTSQINNNVEGETKGLRRRGGGGAALDEGPSHANDNVPNRSTYGASGLQGANSVLASQEYLYHNRVNEMQSVETTIAELGQLYVKVSELVAGQEETVQRIGDNVYEASTYIEKGQVELMKMYERVQGNRSLILKIFGLLIFFIVLYGYISKK